VIVALMAVVAGIVVSFTMLARAHDVGGARSTAEPLVVDAQAVDVDMSDANTTVAGGFLAGPIVPDADLDRFQDDLARAAAALTAATQRAGTSLVATRLLQTLTTDLPSYTAIVATAETNNRRQFPVSTAYLAEADNLMDQTLLPDAAKLYTIEQAGLSRDDGQATSTGETVWVVVLFLLVLTALLWLQVRLSRRFRRTVNPGCAIATAVALGLCIWLIVGVSAEGAAVARAEHRGSRPLAVLMQERILVGEARADDELTLVTRDAGPVEIGNTDFYESSYQEDYTKVTAELSGLMSGPTSGWTAAERQAESGAAHLWSVYIGAHRTVRNEDNAGKLERAVNIDEATAGPVARSTDAALAKGIGEAVSSFAASAQVASTDLDLLPWSGLLLLIGVVAGTLIGVAPRLGEYR
jgi:hypothetical protein